jgi:hypothetical protein
LAVGVRKLFAELSVVVGEFFDPFVSEFETLSPRCFAGCAASCRWCGTGSVVAYGFAGLDEVGLGVDPRSRDAGCAGEA